MTTRFVIFRRKIFVNYGSQMCKNVLQKFCKPEIQLRVKFLEQKRDLKFQQDFLAHILWSPCLKVYWFLSKLIILKYIHIRQAQLQSYVSSIIMKNHKFFLCLYGLLPWQSYRNGKPESSVICQYVCQSVLFVSQSGA